MLENAHISYEERTEHGVKDHGFLSAYGAQIRDLITRDPIIRIAVATLAIVHLATAARYGMHRNELYFIVCGRHPAFGYVDQPPLVPWIAAATQLFGINVWLLRILPIVAAIILIPMTASFTRVLGGDDRSAWMAALAAGIAPLLMGFAATLSTSSFEPLCWTLCAYLLSRAVIRSESQMLIWAGIVAGIALEAKYALSSWMVGLAVGIVLTSARRILFTRDLWLGLAVAMLTAAPSLAWQHLHGWPFLEFSRQLARRGILTESSLQFATRQITGMNLALFPLTVAGVFAPFLFARMREARFLSIAFIVTAAVIVHANGKDYYLAPAYPTMFAVGAVICGTLPRWLRALWMTIAVAVSAILAPVVLPILDPSALASYLDRYGLRPKTNQASGTGSPLTVVFSDELGWHELEQQVAAIYRSLPPEDRARAAILASDYGEAAAIDVYGREDGLPPALSSQLQYYYWGPGDYDGSIIIQIHAIVGTHQFCEQSETVGYFGSPYVIPWENGPIILCRGLRQRLSEVWKNLRPM